MKDLTKVLWSAEWVLLMLVTLLQVNWEVYGCLTEEWSCINGGCIPTRYLCDRDLDCPTGEDELGCNFICPVNTTQCNNNDCISTSWWCDGQADCPDESDEIHCTDASHARQVPNPTEGVQFSVQQTLTEVTENVLNVISNSVPSSKLNTSILVNMIIELVCFLVCS